MKSTGAKLTQLLKNCTVFCIDLDDKDSYIIDTDKDK